VAIGNVASRIVAHHKEFLSMRPIETFARLLYRCCSSSPHPTSDTVTKLLPTLHLNIGERLAGATMANETLAIEIPRLVHCPASRLFAKYNQFHTIEPPRALAWQLQTTSMTSHSICDTAAEHL